MPCILNIETSTTICSVALSVDGKIIYNKESDANLSSHASLLGVYVNEASFFAKQNNFKPDAIAVSEGPGSYTGLRIGISEAKGLCYGWDIPLIAVPTLKIMVFHVINDLNTRNFDFYCPMIDARRMEVYSEIYDKNCRIIRDIEAEIIDENSYSKYLDQGRVLFFGNGSDKCSEVIKSENACFMPDIHPLASSMAALSEDLFMNKQFKNVAYFEPFYLKDFIATTPRNKVIKFI